MTAALGGWMEAALTSMEETADTFGFQGYELLDRSGKAPQGLPGSYISLAGNLSKVQLGLLATVEQQECVARVMLDMQEEPVGTEDREDAMRELANIIAGGVKRGMFEFDPGLTLGLPVFIEGKLEVAAAVVQDVAQVRLGPSQLCVVLLYESR